MSANRLAQLKRLRGEVLASERFAINVLSDFVGVDPRYIKHMSATDETYPIDLQLHNLTFDVKYSSPTFDSKNKTLPLWDFDIRNKIDYCDYFILIGMENERPSAVFAVPGHVAPVRHLRISISGRSKWHAYKVWGKQFPDTGQSIQGLDESRPERPANPEYRRKNSADSTPPSVSFRQKYEQGIEHFLHNPL
jgi:hypothetical protein